MKAIGFYVLLNSAVALILSVSCGASEFQRTPIDVAPNVQNVGLQTTIILPTENGGWVPNQTHTARIPVSKGSIDIEDIGRFTFESDQVRTVRPDVFQPGHFSVFDALVQLDIQGNIDLEYHLDAAMDTHIIDSINGERHWWYEVRYSDGWFESNVFRMDMYPYKDDTDIRVYRQSEDRLADICRTFGEEVRRLSRNDGKVILPEVIIDGPRTNIRVTDLEVTPHNIRKDVFQVDTLTALDILLSLGEQGRIQDLKLTWYDRIAGADPVDAYWTEQIDEDEAFGGCGFVYETGPREFSGFSGSHIHIPSDVRVLVSPEYALWFWICL